MIGERTRVARARVRKPMHQVAAECDISTNMVKKYENDESMPSSGTLLKLCRSLEVSVEWLLAGTPLDFQSSETAPQGRHAKYWVREAIAELREEGFF